MLLPDPDPAAGEIDTLGKTNRELAEELEMARAELGHFRAASSIGWVELDLNRNIIATNDAYCRMLGYDAGELVGRNGSSLFAQGLVPASG